MNDIMYSELIGESYEIEEDFVVGLYYTNDSDDIIYINRSNNEVLDM